MPDPVTQTGVAGALTDGGGIAAFTGSKLVKDFVADALLAIPPALLAAGVSGVPMDQAGLMVAVFAIGGAVMGALYRTVLRWATA